MADKDITKQVDFQLNDDEHLPITKCVCGVKFNPWDFIISIYHDTASGCPRCKRRLYFRTEITVYEVAD